MVRLIKIASTVTFAVAVICVSYVPGWPGKALDVQEELERGRTLYERGRLSEAIETLEEIEKLAPGNESVKRLLLSAYRFKGIEYYGQSRCEEAVTMWKKALEIDPENRELERFIERCKSEEQYMAQIRGDSLEHADAFAKSGPVPTGVAQPESTTTVAVEEPLSAASDSASVASEPVCMISEPAPTSMKGEVGTPWFPTFSSGLSFGLSTRAGGASFKHRAGWVLAGDISIFPHVHYPGARLEGMYTRLHREVRTPGGPPTMEHLSVFGCGVSGVIRLRESGTYSMLVMPGLGVYEQFVMSCDTGSDACTAHKQTTLGVILGLGLRKELGLFTATADLRYLYLGSSISPNFVQVTVGLASK